MCRLSPHDPYTPPSGRDADEPQVIDHSTEERRLSGMSLCGCRGRAAGLGEDLFVLVALSPHALGTLRTGRVSARDQHRNAVPAAPAPPRASGHGVAAAATGRGRGRGPYPTPGGGTVQVYGAIEEAYLRLGGPSGFLGRPLTDELGTPDRIGRYNDFEYGSIFWFPTYGAYEIHGSIRERWATLGSEAGALGYPVSDQLALPDGQGRRHPFRAWVRLLAPGVGGVRGAG